MARLTSAQYQANYRARKAGLPEPFQKFNKQNKHLTHNDWVNYYCGHTWELDYLDNMTTRMWTHHRNLTFLPRGMGKTLRIIGLACRYACERKQPLLIITSGPASKQRIFDSIRMILRSEKIIQRYGEIFESFDRNKCTIQLVESLRGTTPDPVLRVCSRGADIIGSHPKWIHLEDIIQEEFKSDESNEGLQAWFKQVVSFCATHEEGKETRITGTGTRKAKNDFYAFLIEELKYPAYTERALVLLDGIYPTSDDVTYHDDGHIDIVIDKGRYHHLGCPNWPLSRLLIEKILKPLEFRTQMQNEPIDPFGNYFSNKMWNEVEYEVNKYSELVISIDPAFGKSKGSDNTAICVLAKKGTRSFVLVEMFAGKIKSLLKTLELLVSKYRGSRILKIVCEANYLQKIFVVDALNKKLPYTVSPFYSKGEKVLRIQSLHDPMMAKQVMIATDAPGKEDLKEEMLAWIPKESTTYRKDDRLDALQMAYETFVRLLGRPMPRSGKTSSTFNKWYLWQHHNN